MSLYNYFTKLGTINYNNSIVTNIISSIKLRQTLKDKINVYYPYTIKEGDRPETIAGYYYEDERYAWVVYLSNNIIDPYYEWPLSVDEFKKLIIKKYGSVEQALSKPAFYRNAWYKDDTLLTPVAYNALTAERKKYWSPVIGYNGTPVSYERKKIDFVVETNKIISITVNDTDGFQVGEIVNQKTSGIVSGSATIGTIKDSTTLIVKHITGSIQTSGGSVGSLVGAESQATRTVISTANISTPIPNDEFVYWEPVTYYDYENEINESRKNIKLIDRQYLPVLEDQMIELLL